MELPQSTSRTWVINLFKENGFPVSFKNSYWEGYQRLAQVRYLCPRHRNISKGIMLVAGSSRLSVAAMLTSEHTALAIFCLPASAVRRRGLGEKLDQQIETFLAG
jgi:hypothetical protein